MEINFSKSLVRVSGGRDVRCLMGIEDVVVMDRLGRDESVFLFLGRLWARALLTMAK